MAQDTDCGMNRQSASSNTVQSLTFVTLMVSEKITILKFLCDADRATGRRPNTDHYIDSHCSCESKTRTCFHSSGTAALYRLAAVQQASAPDGRDSRLPRKIVAIRGPHHVHSNPPSSRQYRAQLSLW